MCFVKLDKGNFFIMLLVVYECNIRSKCILFIVNSYDLYYLNL